MSQSKAIHARVTGRVQGVSFRAWTQGEARARGLAGWVRNEPDGAVTAVIAGRTEAVDDMAGALETGPPAAVVEAVETSRTDWPGTDTFDILR
ncbi:acylphosphatase [Roseovarius salis]|uniref:acylphosphatase n=1 Tax=Roseovarius salis TaxID=3376063 RepID=UPI0037CA1CE7